MHEQVQDYYGRQLQGSADLQTSACCDVSQTPDWLKPLLAKVHPEVQNRYYGCGLVCPPLLEGCRVLDLGSGAGRDCYLLSQLVGEQGEVIGVDMTDQQLALAERHLDYHRQAFGYANSNVRFLKGYLERLDELELAPGTFDVIVSNCVLNLCTDKAAVLRHAHRLLKPGGEFYFSDVYADRRLPAGLQQDPLLYGECLGGALYWNDFLPLAKAAGFADPRLVEDRPLELAPAILAQVGQIQFYSATYRLFKLEGLEPDCEDYGQAVLYQGTVPGMSSLFELDKHHLIETGRVFPLCGNSYRMLKESRFAGHFQFLGDFSRHFGIFDGCGKSLPFDVGGGHSHGHEQGGGCC